MAETRAPTLEMRGVSKTFPGVKALNEKREPDFMKYYR